MKQDQKNIDNLKTLGINCVMSSTELSDIEKVEIIKMISGFDGTNKNLTFLKIFSYTKFGNDILSFARDHLDLDLPDF